MSVSVILLISDPQDAQIKYLVNVLARLIGEERDFVIIGSQFRVISLEDLEYADPEFARVDPETAERIKSYVVQAVFQATQTFQTCHTSGFEAVPINT